ncbi:MAG: hypothetical protein KCHDKBKB_00732 [Elusimicrobia bacterium]|nr:hypothetical protein [Elusimicrobiota bacterium]
MITISGKSFFLGNWKDWIYHNVPEGSMVFGSPLPMYIPVRQAIDSHALEVWFAPLAPFAFIWYLTGSISAIIYRDHVKWLQMVIDNVKNSPKSRT